MIKFVIGIFIEKVIEAITEFVSNYFKYQKLSKKDKQTAKEIVNEPDRKVAAQRMSDFLNP